LGKAKDDFGGAGEDAFGDDFCYFPVVLWCGVRHGGFTLDCDGQEGMRRAATGPVVFGEAEEPDAVGEQAGGFGGSGDEDGRDGGFSGEDGGGDGVAGGGDEFGPGDEAAVVGEAGTGLESVVPSGFGLKGGTGEGTVAGPGEEVEEVAGGVGPVDGGLAGGQGLEVE